MPPAAPSLEAAQAHAWSSSRGASIIRSPAEVRKIGSGFDLPIAACVLGGMNEVPQVWGEGGAAKTLGGPKI